MKGRRVKVGIVGCGTICPYYCEPMQKLKILDIFACADLVGRNAESMAEKFGIPHVLSVEELVSHPEVEIVLNLTIPAAHAEVALKAIRAGKHVYNEKPIAATAEQGRRILQAARKHKVLVGSAPDTFLGGGLQTCRKIIDDGWIGEPVAASANFMCHGPESWHPSPDFYFKKGAGPLMDMSPYYLNALVNMLGPIAGVQGCAKRTFKKRLITSEPRFGERIEVEIPTHISAIFEFANGAMGTLTFSYDVWAHQQPCIEVHGTLGSLSVPDPNTFGGPVRFRGKNDTKWKDVPLTHGYTEQFRGLGVADMAYAIPGKRKHRASGDLGYHVLDVTTSILRAAESGKRLKISSKCPRPAPLPLGLETGLLDS